VLFTSKAEKGADEPTACPSCCSNKLIHVGEIPASDIFAGRRLPAPLRGGTLFRCTECHLAFRFPVLPEHHIDALYREGAEATWVCDPATREDWKIARLWIRRLLPLSSSILDVGCYDGAFSETLIPSYKTYGVEIHTLARNKAISRGVHVVANRYDELNGISEKFDCIVSFDLIEHVSNPTQFLVTLSKVLRPSGLMILATGNSESRTWRIMGSRYWYCAIAEHLSFISPRWCDLMSQRVGLKVEHQEAFSHAHPGLAEKVGEAVKNLAYRAAPDVIGWLRKKGFGDKDAKLFPVLAIHPPSWMSARDHFIFIATKTGVEKS
jgi:SAM-dependent methyltransferase